MLSHEYYITPHKAGVNGPLPQWDITFTSVDFNSLSGRAYIEGPFSLIVDIDASSMAYPLLFGIELRSVGKSVSVGDRTHIGFASTERRVIGPASVPQLAHIEGVYDSIIVHCFGYLSTDAANCRISLRIGPSAIISAPQPVIGRDSVVYDPGVYFTVDTTQVILPGTANNILWSINANALAGLRFEVKSFSITLPITPSFPMDLIGWFEVITKFGTIEPFSYVYSSDEQPITFLCTDKIILNLGYTLRAMVNNVNMGLSREVRSTVLYGTIY